MKKIILLIFITTIISCENKDDFDLYDSTKNFDTLNYNDYSACDCAPPGLINPEDNGENNSNVDSEEHIFENYDFYGDITISGYTNIVVNIFSKSLLKFSYGINLENGQIIDVAIGNLSPESEVTLIDYSYDKDYYTFHLTIKGYIYIKKWDGKEWIREEKNVYIYETIKIETYKLPTFNGDIGGEQGVFPYSQ